VSFEADRMDLMTAVVLIGGTAGVALTIITDHSNQLDGLAV